MHKRGTTTYTVLYGETVIAFHVAYTQRKTLKIAVTSDQHIQVTAPLHTPIADIATRVQKHGKWILRQLHTFASLPPRPPPRQYRDGETHRYLGHPLQLKVLVGKEGIKHEGDELIVQTADTSNAERIRALLTAWYRRQAVRFFAERIQALLPRFEAFKLPPFELRIRTMKTRWGSCSGKGKITLNLKLMQVDVAYLDYVIVHELCHLIELNHSKRFYALLERLMPDWQERRQRLNRAEVA